MKYNQPSFDSNHTRMLENLMASFLRFVCNLKPTLTKILCTEMMQNIKSFDYFYIFRRSGH